MNKPFGDIASSVPQAEAQVIERVSLERRRLRAYCTLLIADMVLLHLGFIFAGLVYEGIWMEWRALMQAQLLLPLFYTIALYNGTYSARVLVDWRYALRKLVAALAISAALLNFVAFYTKSNASFSRGSFTLGLIFAFVLFASLRWIVVRLVRKHWEGRIENRLVIDDGGPEFQIEGADVIHACDAGIEPDSNNPFTRDRLGQILQHQDRVVVSCAPERREQWAFLLKSAGVHGELLSDTAHTLGVLDVMRYDQQEQSTLVVSTGPLRLRDRATKRAFDLAVAIAGLVLLLPLLIYAALRIKLEDGGRVFFVQRRLGRGNRFFNMIKFRTMREAELDREGSQSTQRGDARVTRIGARLRRTSVDELPQLWNVLSGEMSIVGPRPHAVGSQANNKFFWEVDARYWRRHSLKPGLTGLAQIRGHRGSTEHERDLTDRLQSDLEYIAGWSLRHDVEIMLRTLSVLRHDRAF